MEQLNMKANEATNEQRFVIKDDQSLAWTLELMESKRKQMKANSEMIQQRVDYYKAKNEQLLKDINEWSKAVDQYSQDQLKDNPDWQFETPYGRIVKSKPKVSLVQSDKDALIKQFKGTKYVEQVTTDKLNWSDLKKDLQFDDQGHVANSDGELIKGVEVKKTPAKIEIKHKNDKGNWTTKEG